MRMSILMFHVVEETNPKKCVKIGDKWISWCFMCKGCVDYLTKHHSWALNLKWKTFNECGKIIDAVPENPVPSFGKTKIKNK